MGTLDIYIDDDDNYRFDMKDLAALYNCKVISEDSSYITLEGEDEDLEQFAEFWNQYQIAKWART